MTSTLLAVAAVSILFGPLEDELPAGCKEACEKVTDMTAGRWPEGRKGTQEERDAFESMRKTVYLQCTGDCSRRGKPFVSCIRSARKVQDVSICYQAAKPLEEKGDAPKRRKRSK